jgi:uncharacterized protein (TIGR03083 family)
MDQPAAWVDALRSSHDRLRAFVDNASAEDLAQPSMCPEWNVGRLLGHIGSGADIGMAVATGDDVDNDEVWARWNAMEPEEAASSFVTADEQLVRWFEGLSAEELTTREVQLHFLPSPISAVEAAGFRLGEVALHSWDLFAAFDPMAGIDPEATELLVDRLPMTVGFTGRFTPRETRPATDTTITIEMSEPQRRYELELGDRAELRPATDRPTDGRLDITGEALLRLVAGRLRPGREAGATISGSLSFDDLRRAFPGY